MHWGQGVRWSLGDAILAGIGASACCFGPLILLAVGVSGAWIGNLTVLEPYRPIFIALVLLFLVLAFSPLVLAGQPAMTAQTDVQALRSITRSIPNMTCGLCPLTIIKCLGEGARGQRCQAQSRSQDGDRDL
ncbi:mercuric transporter MerT family protein [Acidihalobacter aeolianus]|uniref:mercuric transporter MerT family protein n=1 Tax=Acidihalobacter aeolianus TaxID=2792603 RepID=UPI000AC1BBFE